jgi:ATP-binding cassette subfamily B protein
MSSHVRPDEGFHERNFRGLGSEVDFVSDVSAPSSGGEKPVRAALEFKNVTFAYPGGSGLPALRDLSFKIEAGKTLLSSVRRGGQNHAGVALLRFYDLNVGSIPINNIDIKDYDTCFLRRSFRWRRRKHAFFRDSPR